MEEKQITLKESNKIDSQAVAGNDFNYDNQGWPRDFDIREEVAEQREILD